MRRLSYHAGSLAAVVLMLALIPENVGAVPAFSRQTGLTCNQCHVGVTPFPDFTFTGVKFRMMGYRFPMVADAMEAGEEGAISGNRLNLSLHNYMSLHLRENLFQQSKPASLESGPEAEWSNLTSRPISSIGYYIGIGPIGDHFGLWNEFYTHGGTSGGQFGGFFSLAEWDIKYSRVFGENNIIGLSMNDNQSLGAVFGFGPFHSGFNGALRMFNSYVAGSGASQAHMKFNAYGMLNDRIALGLGATPGEDNFDWGDGMLWLGLVGFAPLNSDANWLWVYGEFIAGDDAMPMSTSISWNWNKEGGPGFSHSSVVRGLTDTRPGPGAGKAYVAADVGDIVRSKVEVRYGFTDRGPHSLTTAAGLGIERETYADGGEWSRQTLGLTTRYYFERTYGLHFYVAKDLKTEFEAGGTLYDIPTDVFWGFNLIYDMAQNIDLTLGVNNTQTLQLGTPWRPGKAWYFQLHFLI